MPIPYNTGISSCHPLCPPHRVCKAVLETPPGRDCYGICDVFPDRLVVRGADTFGNGEWVLGGGKVVGRAHPATAAAVERF